MYFEDFQDDKQALLRHMQSVDVLVGFHGAGMTNMMFMRPCSSVTQVLSPVHCFWLAAEVFEGLAYMRQLPYSELCLSLENTKMYGGEERAEKSQQLAQQVRETGAHPEQQPYLYKIEELYVTPAELESVVRTGLRSNLLCRSMAEE